MKTLLAAAFGTVALTAHAQMMNDGAWGGDWMGWHGGIWVLILIATAAVVGVGWVVSRKGK